MRATNRSRRRFLKTAAASVSCLPLLSQCASDSPNGPGASTTPPDTPAGLAVAQHNGLVTLSWTPDSSAAARYNVYRDGELLNPSPISQATFTDVEVLFDRSYAYAVSAVGETDLEGVRSSEISVTPSAPQTARLVYMSSPGTLDGFAVNEAGVRATVDAAVLALSGETTIGPAYESFFPHVTDSTKIAIKINTLAGSLLSTQPAVIDAIIAGLASMLGNSYPTENVTVFDDRIESTMLKAGFTVQNTPGLPRILTSQGRWSKQTTDIAGVEQHLSNIVEETDYLISVPLLKDHSLSGITFSLKNSYGTVDKPWNLHDNHGDPFIPATYAAIADKVKLIVGDCLLAACSGGPSTPPSFAPGAILAGTDPVAMDTYALQLINDERTNRGFAAISAQPQTGAARHIISAALPPYSLGIGAPGAIQVTKGTV